MCGGQLWTSLHDVMWYSESTVLTNRWRLCLKDYRKRESIIIMANTYKNQIRCHNFYSGSDYYWKNINHNRVALQFCAEHLFFVLDAISELVWCPSPALDWICGFSCVFHLSSRSGQLWYVYVVYARFKSCVSWQRNAEWQKDDASCGPCAKKIKIPL